MAESDSRKLELTIIVTNDGIYVTSVELSKEVYTGHDYINRKYDSISIDISPLQEKKDNGDE